MPALDCERRGSGGLSEGFGVDTKDGDWRSSVRGALVDKERKGVDVDQPLVDHFPVIP